MIRVIVYPGRGGWYVDFQDGRVRRAPAPWDALMPSEWAKKPRRSGMSA